MKVTGDIVVYAAGDEIICWNFNHRDSARTSLIEGTERAVVFSEALTPEGAAASRRAISELIAILAGHGAGASDVQTASAQTPACAIDVEPAGRQAETAG
jgi:DNA/RNA-binding domain of Phe-tRNA-synthetase-like protein